MRDLDSWEVSRRRKTRSVAIVAVSLAVVTAVAIGRLHSSQSFPGPPEPPTATAAPALIRPSEPSNRAEQAIDLQFLSRNTGWVFTTNRGNTGAAGLFRTRDGGSTWTLIFEGPPSRFHFFDSEHGYVIGLGQPLLTADGGASWHPFASEPGDGIGTKLFALGSPTDALALLSASPNGGEPAVRLFRTVDGGGTWNLLSSGKPDAFGLTAADLPHLQVGYSPPGLVWISAFRFGQATQPIVVSRDGGLRWTRVPLTAPRPGLLGFGPILSEAGDELAAITTWVPADSVVTGPNGSSGFSLPVTGPSYVYSLGTGGWIATPLPGVPGGLSALAEDAPGSVWVAVGPTLCHAISDLLSCHQNTPAEPQTLQLLQLVDGGLFAIDIGTQSIVTSADGGNHWTVVPKPRN